MAKVVLIWMASLSLSISVLSAVIDFWIFLCWCKWLLNDYRKQPTKTSDLFLWFDAGALDALVGNLKKKLWRSTIVVRCLIFTCGLLLMLRLWLSVIEDQQSTDQKALTWFLLDLFDFYFGCHFLWWLIWIQFRSRFAFVSEFDLMVKPYDHKGVFKQEPWFQTQTWLLEFSILGIVFLRGFYF